MKVLQTIGRHSPHGQEGIFQYKRTVNGVFIDGSVGQAALKPPTITLTHQEWTDILKALDEQKQATFRLSRSGTGDNPQQSIYTTVVDAVPNPKGKWAWNDSWCAYVAAILEHEGSIDHYGGPLGPKAGAPIVLARDTT